MKKSKQIFAFLSIIILLATVGCDTAIGNSELDKLKNDIADLEMRVTLLEHLILGLEIETDSETESQLEATDEKYSNLYAVMPEGAVFKITSLIYEKDGISTLKEVGNEVLSIYQESTGLGYAIQCQTTNNYEVAPIILTFGVTQEGEICGVYIDEYTDSLDVRDKNPNFLESFIGSNSNLTDVDLVAGCTYSSMAIKSAVKVGFDALICNKLIPEGKKSAEQQLMEMIPQFHSGISSVTGNIVNATQIKLGDNIIRCYQADNGTGFACIFKKGSSHYLALINAMNVCKVVDLQGQDVTSNHNEQIKDLINRVAKYKVNYSEKADERFSKQVELTEAPAPLPINCFNSIVYAAELKTSGQTLYGFYARPIGFEQMEIYIILDEMGKIVELTAPELIFHKEYFGTLDPNFNEGTYMDGFIGASNGTLNDETVMIGGATMTSNAVKIAIEDAFDAFSMIKEN